MSLSVKEIFILLLLIPQSLSTFRRKCMVVDDKKIHPERPRMPSQKTEHDFFRRELIATPTIPCAEQYDVQIVWHVIISEDGTGSVSDDTIRKQMNVLNDAFKESRLHFRLHSIQRITNDDWSNACVAEKSAFMEALAITPAKVMNAYTCTFNAAEDQIVGNAALPWQYEPDSVYNGVVIHPETMPGGNLAPLNHGKNFVHEVGHYFGLLHYFEGYNCEGDGDMVDDTPVSRKVSYSCDKVPPEDSCLGHPGVDPVHNYMGYADDLCLVNFTQGQLDRMNWIVDMYKKDLKSVVCRPCSIDSVFRWSDGFIYLFSHASFYRYNEAMQSIDSRYPRAIKDHWRGVPNDIDGVFRYSDGITYFFKSSEYYRFNDSTLQVDPGYPKKIKDFWVGIPNDIDDVIQNINGYTYFFKKREFYRFNPRSQNVDPDYPKNMEDYWTGIPANIDAAVTWCNGGIYFFKQKLFWLFKFDMNDNNAIKDSYPKSIKVWWDNMQHFTGYSVFRECTWRTYFVSGDQYWEYNDYKGRIDLFSPRAIWNGMPSRIDGMFVWSDNYLYVFTGSDYYLFDPKTKASLQGYPQKIASFWKGVPNDIDAVFRSSNERTYFFKGSHYYRFNDTTLEVDTGYPKLITDYWQGVPSDLDTVFHSSNGQTYFFKGNDYYRFNFTKGAIDDGYPRHVAEVWKGMLYNP